MIVAEGRRRFGRTIQRVKAELLCLVLAIGLPAHAQEDAQQSHHAVEQAIGQCRFEEAGRLLGHLPDEPRTQALRRQHGELEQREREARELYRQARQAYADCAAERARAQLEQALALSPCEATREALQARIAPVRQAAERQQATQQLFRQAKAAYGQCDYEQAGRLLDQALQNTRCEGHRNSLRQARQRLISARERERRTQSLFTEATEAYRACRFEEAAARLQAALDNTQCSRYRARLDQAMGKVQAAVRRDDPSCRPDDAADPALAEALAKPVHELSEQTLDALRKHWTEAVQPVLDVFLEPEDERFQEIALREHDGENYLYFRAEGRNADFSEEPRLGIKMEIFHRAADSALEGAYGAWFTPLSAGGLGTRPIELDADRAAWSNIITQGLGTEAVFWQRGDHLIQVQAAEDVETLARTVAETIREHELYDFPAVLLRAGEPSS